MSKVISRKNLPVKLPAFQTLLTFLAMDHWNAPSWLWGVASTVWVVLWIICFASIASENDVDIFQTNKTKENG